MIRLSIIIPTFNRLWSLPRAVASCPHGEDVEIIVVDDGSTDGTAAWLADQSGLVVLRQANWGKPTAVNAGMAAARGTYVRFLDSDDMLIAEAARAQLDPIEASGADISVAGYEARFEDSGQTVLHDWIDCGDFLAQQLGECDSSHYSAYLFRRAFLNGIAHRPEFAFRDDRMFILECAIRQPVVIASPQPSLIHCHHARGRIQFEPGLRLATTNWQELQMFRKIAALLEENGLSTARRRAAMTNNLWPLALRIAAFDRREARRVIAWIRRLDPSFRIPAGRLGTVYRLLGFEATQTAVDMARTVRNTVRDVRDLRGARA